MSSAYYARLAGIAMMHHGLNRDDHHELARWAEYAAAHGYTERGVLVVAGHEVLYMIAGYSITETSGRLNE